MIDLGTLGGSSSAAGAIDDKGQVVGSSAAADGSGHFFIWQDGKMSELGSLSPAGGAFSASGINNMSLVAGTSTKSFQ